MQATGRLGKAIGRLALLAGLWWSAWSGADGLIVVMPPWPVPLPGPGPVPRPFVPPGHFRFAPLEVRYHRVEVKIDGRVATTAVDQEFFNPNSQQLEGTYIFPLPAGAHIDSFAMDVNGKLQEAELLDAEKARELYEQIVRQARDPALLEYVGRGAFKARIFPIEPQAGKRVQIRYTEALKSDAGVSEYVYPLNTEKFSAQPLAEVSVRVELRTKAPIQAVYSPSHPVVVERQGERQATIVFAAQGVRPDSDFKLLFSTGTTAVGVDFLPYRRVGGDGFFMLLVSPPPGAETGDGQPKDICFVLDTSGSMAGKKLAQAKRAMEFCLENLDGRDRFEVIRFSTEAELLFGGLRPADAEHRAKAGEFVRGLKPMGGTAIHAALEQALKLGDSADQAQRRPYFVVFITDGLPTVGEIREPAIVDLAGKAGQRLRIFSLGVGVDVNTHLLDQVAEGSRGFSQYVLPEEDLELKLSSFYLKISRPALTDLALVVDGKVRISQLQPAVLPDLFHGDQLLVFGRYQGVGEGEVRLTGLADGQRQAVGGSVVFPETATAHAFIPNLWATRRVGWLLDQIRRQGENQELKDEVTALAREYGIVTPYTAYLILEDEARRGVPVGRRNLRELESDRAAYGAVREEFDSLRQEAASESSRSGRVAVDNAMSIQQLKAGSQAGEQMVARGLAKSVAAMPAVAGQAGGYRSAANYAQQTRRINGRAFYQNGTVWSDSTAQGRPDLKERRIVFNSDEYFRLLDEQREISAWLALGTEVDVVVGDTLYQVREE